MAGNRLSREGDFWGSDLDPMTWDDPAFSASQPYIDDMAARRARNEFTGYDPQDYKGYISTAGSSKAAQDRWGYDPNDLSEAGYAKTRDAFAQAVGDTAYINPNSPEGFSTVRAYGLFASRDALWQDYATATKKFYNAKTAGALADIETGKLKSKQFEQMRKIATEGNEEASEDQRPTGKASVLIGSNIPDRKQKRTSYSRAAGTARAKVKVQAKGINI